MSGNRKVSIVIPTFNRADYLIQCIDSCLAQTVACEIIVCDHGSTDSTPEVVGRYGNKITYIRREKDFGVHFCWLEGIMHAAHDYIHLQFDDDWIEPLFIEKCTALLNDKVGMVLSNTVVYNQDTKTFSEPLNFIPASSKSGVYDSVYFLKKMEYALISPACVIYRKKILLDNLFIGQVPFATNHYRGVGPDLLFFLMTCNEYPKVGYVNENLAVFRAHGNSITTDANKNNDRQKALALAYESARHLYLIKRFADYTRIIRVLTKALSLKIRLSRIFKTK